MQLWYTEYEKQSGGFTLKVEAGLHHEVTPFQTLDILETEGFGRMLTLDGLVMTTERDEFVYHEMISHIPLLSHPSPKNVLVIGGGDGGTVREVLKHPGVESVVLCEIDQRVVEVCEQYLPSIAVSLRDLKVAHHYTDGVEFIKQFDEAFDVILIDSTDPLGPGEGLFTEAFYQNVKKALKPGGLMANQSESPFGKQREFQLVYRLLNKVFPSVHPYWATIPSYPGSYWSWALCFKERTEAVLMQNPELAKTLEAETQYYNTGIHHAAFVLPNFAKALLDDAVLVPA